MQDIYKNIEEYNLGMKRKILIVFDDMIANILIKKKNPIVTKLFIRGIKLNISIVFITQTYFRVPAKVRLNSKHFFIMKIPTKKKELQQISQNHLSDINFKDFIKILKKMCCTTIFF